MSESKHHICPMSRARHLDMRLRRWLHHPRKIMGPYVRAGMTALDMGCGPGFFSIDLAHSVGPGGHVIAADVQDGMLEYLAAKIRGTDLESRITLHKCGEDRIGVSAAVDFVLAFYVVHELPDQAAFFAEMETLLKPDGRVLMTEPPFHVSKAAFAESIRKARAAGLTDVERPKVRWSKAVLLAKRPP